jgi:hypothetical protein
VLNAAALISGLKWIVVASLLLLRLDLENEDAIISGLKLVIKLSRIIHVIT